MSRASLPIDALDRTVAALPDDALADSRRAALEQFKQRGFPTKRDEDWKYTDLANVIDISQRWLATSADAERPDIDRVRELQASIDADWLVIANGELLEDVSTALQNGSIDVSRLQPSGEALRFDDPLADLNLALLQEGVSLRIGNDRSSEHPIGLLIIDSADATPVLSQVRIDIELEANAAARFIEYHVSTGDDEHYSNTHINVVARANARVDYLRFQDRALHHSQTARLNVQLETDSRISHCGIDLGGHLTRNDLKIDILGHGASATFDGLFIAADGQHIDNHTRIDHRVGPAVSQQEYRGILNGRCRAVWNGKAIVHEGADGTDANQANHNLLLSEHAEINAKPELEIYADEVKCAHGTTVGQLDEDALFYLRSRGLDRERAKRVLTRAFAASIVNKSPIAELHDLIGDAVEQRLRSLASGESR